NAFTNQDDFKEIAEQCQMIGLVVWRSTFKISEHQLDSTVRHALTDLKRWEVIILISAPNISFA
ncbi:hypothetical protein C0992_010857, partial [Termitomyces sp. T32_za158]